MATQVRNCIFFSCTWPYTETSLSEGGNPTNIVEEEIHEES